MGNRNAISLNNFVSARGAYYGEYGSWKFMTMLLFLIIPFDK